MQIRVMTNQCYNFVDPALGKVVEARETACGSNKVYYVSVAELERVGCTGVEGMDYPFYADEVLVLDVPITVKE